MVGQSGDGLPEVETHESKRIFQALSACLDTDGQFRCSKYDVSCSRNPRLTPLKIEGGVSLVTSAGKVVDFCCLVQAVPMRLQRIIK